LTNWQFCEHNAKLYNIYNIVHPVTQIRLYKEDMFEHTLNWYPAVCGLFMDCLSGSPAHVQEYMAAIDQSYITLTCSEFRVYRTL